ncbi:Predicted transcriptional regulator [Anaerobiospirillum thomasii]|uniref:Predicted transcriptional regulator n=1 Tax=Anaerobiospirillum thomasii TaxID=179995 RepID=A0A2X0V9I1_9GAMM|nr:helix-turn-helix transcriptional regulator [Anaerobiospirillum thomasii]SPT70051.1 Predicted transcriptional regulator [Anaerobiospirillum thomasii]SPT71059.1 Predicted transcriptional regulator [Anaerobiospirillum thomasii]SPT71306.1 Predicted transcriptional regulator [Anaerobiospirillum thomasii]SPT78984.1 Predicted transcriptional regulator [Anaerobiospirillum thomasii]
MDSKLYKRLRLAMGLSPEELAAQLGISAEYVSKMERGLRPVTDRQAEKIKTLLFKALFSDDPCFKVIRDYLRRDMPE